MRLLAHPSLPPSPCILMMWFIEAKLTRILTYRDLCSKPQSAKQPTVACLIQYSKPQSVKQVTFSWNNIYVEGKYTVWFPALQHTPAEPEYGNCGSALALYSLHSLKDRQSNVATLTTTAQGRAK